VVWAPRDLEMRSLLSWRVEVSPRRWILLPIGFALKTREFDGNAMLAFEAAERGWGTLLGDKSLRHRANLPRGMLIEKNIAPGTSKKVATSLIRGQKLAACCEEGLVYNNADEYGRRKVEKTTYDLLELFFCWGKNHAEDMLSLGCNGDKLIRAGNPRFDLHRPELRNVFTQRVEEIREKYAPFILVTTKFSHYNGYYSPEAALAKMRELGKVQTPKQEAEALGQIAFHRRGFHAFMELVDQTSRTFPDHRIVVRPHPSERHDPWHAKAAALPNVEIIFEGNVIEWLLAADACIHNNCTTGVESYLLGKTPISYRPVCDPQFDLYLPNALSAEAFDLETAIRLVGAVLRGKEVSTTEEVQVKADVARRFIENIEGKRACERFLDALDGADLPEERLAFSVGPLNEFKLTAQRTLQRVRKTTKRKGGDSLRVWSGESAARKRGHALRSDNVNRADLITLLEAARRVTGRFSDVQIVELEKNLLCIF